MALGLRTRFTFLNASIVALGIIQILLVVLLLKNQRDLERSQETRYVSWKLANELRHSSDELTRTARTYVVTGDRTYLEEYWHILDVRDGKAPRLDGRMIPLRTLISRAGTTLEEEAKLNMAEDNSNSLVATEVAAFQAMDGRFMPDSQPPTGNPDDYTRKGEPDQAYAIRIMHDTQYHADKDIIMIPISEFEEMLDRRTQANLETYRSICIAYITASIVTACLLVAATLASYLGSQLPAARAIETIVHQLGQLARGEADLKARLHVDRQDEIGELASSFNALLGKLEEMVAHIEDAAGQVLSHGARILRAMQTLEQGISTQSTGTSETTATTRQISSTAGELARTVNRVAETVGSTVGKARSGRESLHQIHQKMDTLLAANGEISARLAAINEKTSNIGTIATTISKVAEQTNLLSLNASIEAEKAGEFGTGFAVVAREIRRLADSTTAAAADIEQTIREVEDAVAAGSGEMTKFRRQMSDGTREVQALGTGLADMAGEVETLAPLLDTVRQGSDQQAESARAIHTAMNGISESMQQTIQDLKNTGTVLTELESTGRTLRELLGRFSSTHS